MTALHITIGIFCVYLFFLVALALWSRGESNTVAGYYVAGKKLPYWVVAFSTNATGESGWLMLGLTGMGYAVGIHALWIVLGEVIGVGLSWMLIASRLKRATDQYDAITIPDYLESRFQDTLHILRVISVTIILIMVATYTGAQLVATGKAFSEFLAMPYTWGVIIGALITMVYTAVGGFKAVAYTDVFQGILMLFALLILPLVCISEVGGWSAMTQGLTHIDPALTNWWGDNGMSLAGWIAVASFIAIGMPFLGVPQLLVRYISIRDEAEIKPAAWISVLSLFFFTAGAVLTGMAGRVLFPELPDPELIMPTVSRELFHPFITALLIMALMGAIMSTVDSLFILASSAFTRDVVQRIFFPDLSDHTLAMLGRGLTIVIGIVGILIALSGNRLIFWFVLFSWSGLGATFAPVILCALYWKRTTMWGAAAGMLGGFLTTMIWAVFVKQHVFNLYEMIPGFLVGLMLTVLVSCLTSRSQEQENI